VKNKLNGGGHWCSEACKLIRSKLQMLYNAFIMKSSPGPTTFLTKLCNAITHQLIELERCSNPIRSLLVQIEKKVFRFRFGVLYGWRHNGCMFLPFWPSISDPGY